MKRSHNRDGSPIGLRSWKKLVRPPNREPLTYGAGSLQNPCSPIGLRSRKNLFDHRTSADAFACFRVGLISPAVTAQAHARNSAALPSAEEKSSADPLSD